jgi:hypothetical protein
MIDSGPVANSPSNGAAIRAPNDAADRASNSAQSDASNVAVRASWLVRYRGSLYPIANVVIWLASIAGAAINDIPFGVVIYVCLLFGVCSTPLLLMKRINDRYAVLAIFLLLYFLFFGALDLQTLLIGTEVVRSHDDFLSSPELAILSGAAAFVLCYQAGVMLGYSGERRSPAEWPSVMLPLVGIPVWLAGTAAMIYFQVFVMPSKVGIAAAKGLASMGPILTFVVMLGHMMQPLGILICAYGYAKFRNIWWFGLVVLIVMAQVFIGFIEDIKMQAAIGIVLVIMVRTLRENRLPIGWIAAGLVFLVVAFPIFQAYRAEVTGARGLDREQAFRELDKVIDIVLASREKVTEGHNRSETFVERASNKHNVEILFDHVGVDVPYLYGHSLVGIPMAFVPRLIVPDKEDFSVGMLFGKQILKAEGEVYISISHLGELYWNFGWMGVLLGMGAFGTLLGFVGMKFNLEQEVTLTRILVLLITVQSMCIGFSGTMPVSYLLWMRSMAAIGLMHLLFARKAPAATLTRANIAPEGRSPPPQSPSQPALQSQSASQAQPTFDLGKAVSLTAPTPRFPNLMR